MGVWNHFYGINKSHNLLLNLFFPSNNAAIASSGFKTYWQWVQVRHNKMLQKNNFPPRPDACRNITISAKFCSKTWEVLKCIGILLMPNIFAPNNPSGGGGAWWVGWGGILYRVALAATNVKMVFKGLFKLQLIFGSYKSASIAP